VILLITISSNAPESNCRERNHISDIVRLTRSWTSIAALGELSGLPAAIHPRQGVCHHGTWAGPARQTCCGVPTGGRSGIIDGRPFASLRGRSDDNPFLRLPQPWIVFASLQ